ncbi:MAG: hypothetical protein ACLQVG_24225 [Terriglobia bacterium]
MGLLAAVVVALTLPINGQQQGTQATQQQNTTRDVKVQRPKTVTPASPQPISVVITQETSAKNGDRTEEHTKSYLSRLLSPENLPNVALVIAGFIGIIIALGTLKAINREYVATHRPKLVVRELEMLSPKTHPSVTINYIISNAGSSRAEITESVIEVQHSDSGIVRPLGGTERLNLIEKDIIENPLAYPNKSLTIEPGAFVRYRHSSEIAHQSLWFTKTKEGEAGRLFFRGRIVYFDGNGTQRQIAFCRYYDFKAGHFRRLDDPDYEYED